MGIALAVASSGCGLAGGGDPSSGSGDLSTCHSCSPILTPQEVADVRQTFAKFQPEEFAGGVSPTVPAQDLIPFDFAPAQFFGPPTQTADVETTPLGISVRANGYDTASYPDELAPKGIYFNWSQQPNLFTLSVANRSPLNELEGRMGLPLTPGAPTVDIDLRKGRVDLSRIDQDMSFIQGQLAEVLPDISQVDPTNAQIVIEPTIFYVQNSNFGDTWAGGETEPLGGNKYQIHLADFYIRFDSQGNMIIVNWEDYLVDEAINFYVMSIGRGDLAK